MRTRDQVGWIFFLISAAFFTVAGLRAGDPLVVIGSIVFGIACVLFLSR